MAQDSLRGGAGRSPSGGSSRGDHGAAEGWTVLSHLLSGILVFGAAGWGLDQFFGTHWILLVGLLLGGAASFGLIYIRYVYDPTDSLRPGGPAGREHRKEHG